MKYTKHTLKKVEDLFAELNFEIIYGKGNFQSGYCLVENQNKVVVNRFFETEARINSLADILSGMEIPEGALSDKSADFLQKLLLATAQDEETAEEEGLEENPEILVVEEKED